MDRVTISSDRWQLYRLLSDPTRLRLLALAAVEELSVGELAELLGESQPNVSRHAAPLRKAGLLSDRRQGTRTLIRLGTGTRNDAVVLDALATGRELCEQDGSLERIADVVSKRDDRTREFFARPGHGDGSLGICPELPAYLFALAPLFPNRTLAVDAGTGDGSWLDVLSPIFERVVALDRSEAQIERAKQRSAERGFNNVEFLCEPLGAGSTQRVLGKGADLVVASRMLHHAPLPREAMGELVALAREGGFVLIIDYAHHDDERLSEQQADVWLGFEPEELR
ncbi:MAG: ArsR family transcriptional regulator, partial [Myxococcales bacterium]|nr:ArsR family transcriptional regulator [Myxococcales bacterium]